MDKFAYVCPLWYAKSSGAEMKSTGFWYVLVGVVCSGRLSDLEGEN